jgi:hypothetical protein
LALSGSSRRAERKFIEELKDEANRESVSFRTTPPAEILLMAAELTDFDDRQGQIEDCL